MDYYCFAKCTVAVLKASIKRFELGPTYWRLRCSLSSRYICERLLERGRERERHGLRFQAQ